MRMLENNNRKIITKMAVSSLRGNKPKSAVMIIAVMLSSFMLFSVFTVGSTYFKMQQVQNIHLHGADFDAVLHGGYSEQQLKQCKNNQDVRVAGAGAYAGAAVKTDADDTLHTGLIWCDETNWSVMMKPARKRVRGYYPKKENELMVTKAALKDCGKENLDVGDTFDLTYTDQNGTHTKNFLISGIWEGYGEQELFYVSEAFYNKTGYQLNQMGVLYVKFKNKILTEDQRTKFQESIHLNKRQNFQFTGETEKSAGIFAGMAGLVLVTCLSAYLLIYNILYLSVSGNIRYYGLMQTVGMSSRQIRLLMKTQIMMIGTARGWRRNPARFFNILSADPEDCADARHQGKRNPCHISSGSLFHYNFYYGADRLFRRQKANEEGGFCYTCGGAQLPSYIGRKENA